MEPFNISNTFAIPCHLAKIHNFRTIHSLTHFIKHLMCIPKSMIFLISSPTTSCQYSKSCIFLTPHSFRSDQEGQIKFHIHQWKSISKEELNQSQNSNKSYKNHHIYHNYSYIINKFWRLNLINLKLSSLLIHKVRVFTKSTNP